MFGEKSMFGQLTLIIEIDKSDDEMRPRGRRFHAVSRQKLF